MEAATWRTVPVEPTEAMLVNGREALMPLVRLDSYGPLIGIWKDMLAASPVVPVGVRERVAREICRIVRTWQGFVPTEEYTLEMEVENAWDDWLSEADAILAALRPTDTGWEA
jgi:hypothetical protein